MIWTDELSAIPNTVALVYPQVRLYCETFIVAGSTPMQPLRTDRIGALLRAFPVGQRRSITNHECARSLKARAVRYDPGLTHNRDYRPYTEYYLGPAFARLFEDGVPNSRSEQAGLPSGAAKAVPFQAVRD